MDTWGFKSLLGRMGKARVAKNRDTITIVSGKYEGATALALEDAEGKITFKVRLLTGPHHGLKINVHRGDYIVGG